MISLSQLYIQTVTGKFKRTDHYRLTEVIHPPKRQLLLPQHDNTQAYQEYPCQLNKI